MSDLDLLVEARHARDAFAIASRCGWRRAYDREFDWIYRTMHHLPPLRDERSGAMAIGLELHTDILPPAGNPFAFSARELWGEAIHAPGLPDGIRVPSVRHRLLHCCIHFAWSHRLCSGAWKAYRDVTAIASDGSFDWNGFAGLAESSRATACVFWTLRQARALVGARIPSDVLERTKPTLPDSLIQLLERHLSANIVETALMCPSERVRAWLWRIAIRPDRDMYGAEPRRVEEGLPWHLLIGDDGGSARRGVRRTSLSPRAWRRYLATLYGSSSLR